MQYGRYEVKSELGRGGMGTLYVAYDPQFQREVALKVLHPGFLEDPAFRMRFDREARLIARLEHKAIVPVYDYGEDLGQPFLVMRLMKGGTLEDRLKQGPLALDEINDIMQRLCSALSLAHGENIIHRDIKPKNILFDDADEAYLADFGIARLASQTSTMTMTGTPAYMSPEQVKGETVDHRTDIYQLGMVLYEMLTGRMPFQADTPAAALFHHAYTPPAPAVTPADNLPADMETVVQTALAKEKERRYQTAAEFGAALDTVVSGRPLPGAATLPPVPADAPTLYEPLPAYPPPDRPDTPPPYRPVTPAPMASPPAGSPRQADVEAAYEYFAPGKQEKPTSTGRRRTSLIIGAGAGLVGILLCICVVAGLSSELFDLGSVLGGLTVTELAPDEPANFGDIYLEADFSPAPHQERISAGGDVSIELTDTPVACTGFVTNSPDLRLNWSGDSVELDIGFTPDETGVDTVLLIRDPAGSWTCNDDFNNLDPLIIFLEPDSGTYEIWVGIYDEGDAVPGTLTIDEPAAQSQGSGNLEIGRAPLFGADELSAGFSLEPFTVTLEAGGPVILGRALAGEAAVGCVGGVTSAPSYRLTWTGRAEELRFFLCPLAG